MKRSGCLLFLASIISFQSGATFCCVALDFSSFDCHFMKTEKNDCVRLVLLGRTGSGKSATGNTLLGNKQFESRPSGSSVTNSCTIIKGRIEERQVAIVDTPGIFDTRNPNYESMKEVMRCIHLSSPGPHAFILVLKADRFTEEENNTVNSLLELFGDHMLAFTIIIFTRLDDIEDEGTTIEEYVKGSTDALKGWLKRVKFRYIAFNNRGTAAEKVSYVASLKLLIDNIQKANNGKYYTSEMFTEAEDSIRDKTKFLEKTKEHEKQRIVEKVEAKFKTGISNAEQIKRRLTFEKSKQKEQTRSTNSEYQDLRQQIFQMQQDLQKTKANHQTDLQKIAAEEKQKIEAKLNAGRKQQTKVFAATLSLARDNERRLQHFESETKAELVRQKMVHDREMRQTVDTFTETRSWRTNEKEKQLLHERYVHNDIISSHRQLCKQIENTKAIEKEMQMQREMEERIARKNLESIRRQRYSWYQ